MVIFLILDLCGSARPPVKFVVNFFGFFVGLWFDSGYLVVLDVAPDFCFIVSSVVSILLKVGQEVGPHHVSLVDVAALGLGHLDEVVNQQFTVVSSNPPGLLETLIRVEGQVFSFYFEIFCFVLEHVTEGGFLDVQ